MEIILLTEKTLLVGMFDTILAIWARDSKLLLVLIPFLFSSFFFFLIFWVSLLLLVLLFYSLP